MNSAGTRVVTLGTAGGPVWWSGPNAGKRCGISTAVVVGDRVYLVDAGSGVGRQMMLAGLPFQDLRAVFVTHLHSDHIVDLGSLALFGMMDLGEAPKERISIFGPGDRGLLPPISPRADTPPAPLFPDAPTPGTHALFETLMRAYATDLNDRVLDSLRPTPFDYFDARDIIIPAAAGFHANTSPTPDMDPFVVYEDDVVRVTAILVEHPPIAPAFAYRFDTDEGSVVISGDTTETPNTIKIAENADVLLHEAIDFEWVKSLYADRTDDVGQAMLDHHHKSHTSPRGAMRIAEAAGARYLALHHLVPGTTPTEVWYRDRGHFSGQFNIPHDLEVIPVGRQRTSLSYLARP